MKVSKIILISVISIVAFIFIGGFIFLKNMDMNRYVPQIVDIVFNATGRQLTVGHAALGLSFNKGVVLDLKEVSLSDDKKFSDQLFLKIAQARLAIDLGAIVIDKKIVISDVTIFSPEIRIIRSQDGAINAASMGASAASLQPGAQPGVQPGAQSSTNSNAVVLPALLVKKIEIKGAVVRYIDQLFDPVVALDIEQMDIVVKGFSLVDPFQFSINAALFSESQNVNVSGRAGLDIVKLSGRFESVKIEAFVDKIQASRLNAALPMIKPLGFNKAGGTVSVELKEAIVGVKGLESLDAQGTVHVKGVLLEGGNILAAGLNSISMFPGLVDTLLAELPSETQENIKKGITAIDVLEVVFKADKDVLILEKAELSTHEVAASVNGTVALVGALNLSSAVYITPSISELIVHKMSDLGGLKKEDGRIYIPFSVSGVMLKPEIRPDVDYLTKHLLMNRGKQELQKVLKDPAVSEAVGELFNTIFKSK